MTMPPRPDVVTLLLDTAPGSAFTHRDGRRFTAHEIDIANSATAEDCAAAAEILLRRRPPAGGPPATREGS